MRKAAKRGGGVERKGLNLLSGGGGQSRNKWGRGEKKREENKTR